MKTLKKIWKIFLAMPTKERVAIVLLATVFFLSLARFIIDNIRFPAGSVDDVFAEGMVGHVDNINPVFVDFNDTDRDISELVFSGLIKYDPVQRNFLPDLAESFERSDDGLTYTFRLHQNAVWHDGTPLTSADVLFTFKTVIQDTTFTNPIVKDTFASVIVEAPDPHTVTLSLPRSNSYFISNLTTGILPKHLLEGTPVQYLVDSPFNQNPVGSGPYKVDSVKLSDGGDRVDLMVFGNYYDAKPEIEQIRIYTFPTEKALLKEKTTLHGIAKLSGAKGREVAAEDERFNNYEYVLNQFTALYLNTENPFLTDKEVRRALSLAINKKELIFDDERRADTLGLADLRENARFAYNLERAGEILDRLDIKMGDDGVRTNSKGEKLSITLLTLNKTKSEISETIRKQWAALGIQVFIEVKDGNEFADYVSQRRYGALLIRQNLGYNRDVYPLFHSSQVGSPGGKSSGLNFSNFRSFGTDGLTEAIRKATVPEDKQKLLEQLSSTVSEEVPVIFISTPVYSYLLDRQITEFSTDNLDFHSDRLSVIPY